MFLSRSLLAPRVAALLSGPATGAARPLSTSAPKKPPSAAATALDAALKSLARVLHPDALASAADPAAAAAHKAAFQALQDYSAAARGSPSDGDGVRGGAFRFRFYMRGGDEPHDGGPGGGLVGPIEVRLRPPPPAPGPALSGLGPLLAAAGLRPPEVVAGNNRQQAHAQQLSLEVAAAEEAALASPSLAVSLPAAASRARRLAAIHAGVNLEAARVRAALRLVHGARVSVAGGLAARLEPPARAGLMARLASAADAAVAALPTTLTRPLAGLHIVVGAPGEGGVDAAGAVWLPADGSEAGWAAALAAAVRGGGGSGAGRTGGLVDESRLSAERAAALSLGVDAVMAAGAATTTAGGEAYENALDALLTAGLDEGDGDGRSAATLPPRPALPGVVLELDTCTPPLASPLPPGHVRVVLLEERGLGLDEAGVVAAVRAALAGGAGAAAQAAAAEAAGVAATGATLREAAREATGARSVSVGPGLTPEQGVRGAATLFKAGQALGPFVARGVGLVIGSGGGVVECAPEGGRVVVGWDCEV
jgi:hypothetical protein